MNGNDVFLHVLGKNIVESNNVIVTEFTQVCSYVFTLESATVLGNSKKQTVIVKYNIRQM